MDKNERILLELVLNWKLRLVASAFLSMLGLSFMVATVSGFFVELTLLDQTIVGVAVFIVMIPIYLIIADLPKIDEHTITSMLNKAVPEFKDNADLILKDGSELSEEQMREKEDIEHLYQEEKLYRYLPNRPIKQASILLIICLALTAGSYFYLV